MPKFFYRIEHRTEKIGVYNCLVTYEGLPFFFSTIMRQELGYNFCDDYHMNPRMNGLGKYMGQSARYGFASLVKLRRWFGTNPKTYALFTEYGFVLRRFKVDERFDSDRQSIAMVEKLIDGKQISFDKVLKNQ